MYFQLKINDNFIPRLYVHYYSLKVVKLKQDITKIYNTLPKSNTILDSQVLYLINRLPDEDINVDIPQIISIQQLFKFLYQYYSNDSYSKSIMNTYFHKLCEKDHYLILNDELINYNRHLCFSIDNFSYMDLIFLLTEDISNEINIVKELDIFSFKPILFKKEIDNICNKYIYQESDSNITRKYKLLNVIYNNTSNRKLKTVIAKIKGYYKQIYKLE